MREYKFRGLRLDGRCWAYGDLSRMANGERRNDDEHTQK